MPVQRSGLVPYYIDGDGSIWFCLMVPSDPKYGGTDPQIAKGILEDDLEFLDNAIKEAQEELGYIHKEHYDIIYFGERNNIQIYFVGVDDTNLDEAGYETGEVVWIKDIQLVREWQRPVLQEIKNLISQ